MTAVFVVAALVALAGAVGVLRARQPVHSVLALILNFGALAVLYLSLSGEFMAVVQLIIYAGAIMVLFLFVIGLLTARLDPAEKGPEPLRGQVPAAAAAMAVLGLLLAGAGLRAAYAPAGPSLPAGFGGVRAFGHELLVTHVFPFELTAFVLMVAVVGVLILVGRRHA